MTQLADATLQELAATVGARVLAAGRRLVTAESCTGGWIGKVLTDVPGSSAWFAGGGITYSNELKQRVLGVQAVTLAHHGAVSEATVREMAEGALANFGGDIAVAVSGIAGPDGGSAGKPVGTVCFAWSQRGETITATERKIFSGDRESVRRQTVAHALARILEL